MCLNPLKAIGQNGISTKTFKFLVNDVSFQLPESFNLSFSQGVFLLILLQTKPVYKKSKCFN